MPEGTMLQDMWTPYKELRCLVESVLSGQVAEPLKDLDVCLQKNKQNFLNLLKNPPKSAKDREDVKKGSTEGITLPDLGHQVLSKELVDEAIIVSDMYDLNEYLALDLLCTAQEQMSRHPGLPRGLVAILLYYDGRLSLVHTLRLLVQARSGLAWKMEISQSVSDYITDYTDKLMSDGIMNKILDVLDGMDLAKELELLQQNRALGGPKHHRDVVEMMEGIRQMLADIVYCWAAQSGLPKEPTLRLIQQLKKTKIEEESTGGIDGVTLALQMALLFALDLSIAQQREDGEEIVERLPLLSDPEFLKALHKELYVGTKPWECAGLQALTQLAWGLVLATVRSTHHGQQVQGLLDDDDGLIESAVNLGVFNFLQQTFLANKSLFKEVWYLRRLHCLITDFIVFMPLKVKDLRNRAEDTARTTQIYAQEGLDPPSNLSHHFEQLLLTIAHLYDKNPLNLDLVMDYWCPTEGVPTSAFPFRLHARQVALFKFLRVSGDNLSPTLFVAYVRMLCSLASSPRSARHCFNLLKQNGPVNGSNVSWDHFFTSLNRYYANLRQEMPPKTDTVYHHRIHPKGITPQEIQGLQSVLNIIRTVAENDDVSRAAICENQDWQAINVLLGLVSCAVPVNLKAELVNTLAALGRTPDTATILWHSIEAAQILSTIPSTSSYQSRGVQTELEEIESRAEEFPLTRAMLRLLDVLTNASVPRLLGVGTRAPGFDPYFNYVLHSVFLRAPSRSYQKPQEKWDVMRGCLDLFVKFLVQYDPDPKDFEVTRVELQSGGTSQVNPQPGYHLMVHLLSKSELLRLVLSLLEEGCLLLDTYAPQAGKEALEASMLGCLRLLERALALQQRFLSLVSAAGSQLLLTGLSRLLLGLNIRSGKPDYMLCVAKYVTYNAWLPEHALSAVKILLSVTLYPKASGELVGIFTSNQSLKLEICHGFVECLEAEDSLTLNDDEEVSVIIRTKEMILRLLQQCLSQPAPNLAHYLLGFQLTKELSKTVFQQPGVMGFPRNCLHSILTMLDSALKTRHVPAVANVKGSLSAAQAGILESSYGLLYNLCAGNRTSQPVLRFLRTSNNFLARHLAALPFNGPHHAAELNQMSWLLKMVAIEMKISATRQQFSLLASLTNILAGTLEKGQTDHGENEDITEMSITINVSHRTQVESAGTNQYDKLMLRLLALLDFSEEVTPCPNWEVFVPEQFEQVLKECETVTSPGLRLIDVKRLHHILIDHLSVIQGNSTAGQRQRIVEEIQEALKYSMDCNKQRTRTYAHVRFMDAWRQTVEVLFCVTPLEVLPCPFRLQILLDTLHLLINKVLQFGDIPGELSNLTSNALLLLLVNLRHSYVLGERTENEEMANGKNKGRSQASQRDLDTLALAGGVGDFGTGDGGPSPGGGGGGGGRAVLEENSAKLNVILSGILQWMLRSGVASQKLRANLYSSLLTFMHIVCLPERSNVGALGLPDPSLSFGGINKSLSLTQGRLDGSAESRLEQKSPLQASLDLVLSFGGRIVDVMCHDCTGGHDVCKMLTLSCLDKLIELDPHSSWVPFLSDRGYLKHLIDSLLDSDANGQLESMLFTTPESLRPLYVYESKMALLCRVASTRIGAEMLLEQKALSVLASMKVYDHHPIMHSGSNETETDGFIPSVGERYLQILLPALHLCDAVLSSLGVENQSCVAQVVHFLLCHVQTFGLVLGSGSPYLRPNYLKELVHVTGVIARSANQGLESHIQIFRKDTSNLYTVHQDDTTTALDRKAHLLRIQNLMLALFPHFIITESLIKKVRGSNTQTNARNEMTSQESDDREEAVLHVLRVAAHLLLYAHNLSRSDKSDYRSMVPVFKPSLATHHSHRTASDYSSSGLVGGERIGETQPVLGVVVDQLVASVSHHRKEKATLELLTRKLASLPELSTVELQEFLPEGTSAIEQRSLAAQQLRVRVEQKERELSLTSYIVDNCLHLVWLHLDFYLQSGLPLNRACVGPELMPVIGAPMNATWQVSLEDISQLKQSLVSVFNNNNTFCTYLVETKQNASEMESGFVEALLRRIIRLIQFVPVK